MTDIVVGAVDVHYPAAGGAQAALVVCGSLSCAVIQAEYVAPVPEPAPYEPGALYRRELPCIQAVVELAPALGLLVVDGYATLDPDGAPGLGAHAAEILGIPVIGVAKTPFHTATHAVQVFRGRATRPLHVTAVGLPDQEAARIVAGMAGPHRLPTVLQRVDRLARSSGAAGAPHPDQ